MDEVNGANLSHGPCVCEDENTTRLPEKVRTTLSGCGQWSAHRALPRKHECCHWRSRCALSRTHRFSTFANFPLRVQILIVVML